MWELTESNFCERFRTIWGWKSMCTCMLLTYLVFVLSSFEGFCRFYVPSLFFFQIRNPAMRCTYPCIHVSDASAIPRKIDRKFIIGDKLTDSVWSRTFPDDQRVEKYTYLYIMNVSHVHLDSSWIPSALIYPFRLEHIFFWPEIRCDIPIHVSMYPCIHASVIGPQKDRYEKYHRMWELTELNFCERFRTIWGWKSMCTCMLLTYLVFVLSSFEGFCRFDVPSLFFFRSEIRRCDVHIHVSMHPMHRQSPER